MKRTAFWIITIFFFAACSTAPKRVMEAPPSYQSTPQSTPVRIGIAQAPKLVEVRDAVKRVFKDAAVIDASYNPNFLAGDFNGDASQDIAVIIKPAKLDEINQDLPPWLLREPRSNKPPTVRLRIEKDDVLLAVIHGYGTNDWRDPEATQTFLLKNVVGSDLHVESGNDFAKANSGKRLPRPQGDLIAETVQGTPGYLYYATATYSWYDPKTFKGETQQTRMLHQPKPLRAHAQAQQAPAVAFITAEELKTKMVSNYPVTVIDVRSSEGYAASSTTIKGALHVKLRKLKSRLAFVPLKNLPKDREVVTYCACPKDESSIKAAQILVANGFTRVKVLQGGWNEWLRASGPVQPK
ncbi:MAG TPA: rhodanese-like domain-containing protein [Pyrinomonadaceae bacterium]|nr:rhodanese-like domain-containing protein [Pyrinomonadaceae bacterium]